MSACELAQTLCLDPTPPKPCEGYSSYASLIFARKDVGFWMQEAIHMLIRHMLMRHVLIRYVLIPAVATPVGPV
jgi:hypothetical protein